MGYKQKLYDLGLICGRMQHIHIGHQHIIDMGLMTCNRVIVLLGSSQESGTIHNPFSYECRNYLLHKIYSEECIWKRLMVAPLQDMSADPEHNIIPAWGKYVLDNVIKQVGKKPDVMLYGNDEARSKWFDKKDIKDMMEIIIPRTRIDINATKIRELMANNEFEKWSRYTDPLIHEEFYLLRKNLLAINYYQQIADNISSNNYKWGEGI